MVQVQCSTTRGVGEVMHQTSSRVLLIVASFVLLLVPVAAIAAGGFTDVSDDSVFKADIAWLADAGVTKGCNPPANDKFCPGSNVTREQMAAFMHRLATNRVVDAKTAVTATKADNADNATNADKLDGKDSTAFLAVTGKAVDSDLLDGEDSTAFAASGHDHDAAYLAKTGKAADANLLDGFDSSAFAKASNVYTKSEIDASTASALIAGGWISSSGTLWTSVSSFGDFTPQRDNVGRYTITLPAAVSTGCVDPHPFPILNPQFGHGTVTVISTNCDTGDVGITIEVKAPDGTLIDDGFRFTMYHSGGGLSPAATDARTSASYCILDVATGIETCE